MSKKKAANPDVEVDSQELKAEVNKGPLGKRR